MRAMLSQGVLGVAAGTADTLFGVPEQEHPAAKAGRFVRAAGLALSRGLEKQAAKAEAAAPAMAPPPPPPPPPPPIPTDDLIGKAVFYGFVVSFFAFLLVVLHVEMVLGETTAKLVFRLVLAAILFVEAYLLTSNWQRANQRLVQRLLNRMWGARAPINRREKMVARAARDGLTLVGIAWLAAGAFEFLGATIGY